MNAYNDMYKKVVCLNNNLVFKNLKEASEYSGIDELDIIYCCKGINLYCKNENNEKLTWRFHDEFINMDEDIRLSILKEIEEDISEFENKIICLDTNHIYDNINDASCDTKVPTNIIKRCCDNMGTYICYKNKNRHSFMYMEQYLNLNEEEKEELINRVTTLINRPVVCLNLNKKFSNIDKASKFSDISPDHIENNCTYKTPFVKNKNHEKFVFMHYEDYSKLDPKSKKAKNKEAKITCLNRTNEVICLNNNEVFDSIEEASIATNISVESIERCCNKKRKFSLRKDGKRFIFMYHTEYLLLNSKERKKILKTVDETKLKRVVDVETGTVYESAQEASYHSKFSAFTIRQQCNKKESYSIRSKTLYPSWLYYEDYCKRLKKGKIPNRQNQLDKTIEENQVSNEVLDEVAFTTN